MARLIDDTGSRLLETAKLLFGHSDFSDALGAEIRRNGGTDRAVQALLREFRLGEHAQREHIGGYRDAPSAPTPSFPIWRTLMIGGKTKKVLIAEMKSKGFKIGDCARRMLDKEAFTTLPEPRELTLVRPTVAKLGFAEGGTTADIWARAKALGLRLCLAEVGPRLRLVDADQAKGGGYWIGMETITDSDDSPHIFKVGHDDNGRWLCSCVAWPGVRWYPDERLVFTASGKPA